MQAEILLLLKKADNPCFVLFTRQCLKSSGSIRGIKVITCRLLLSSRMREPPVWELLQSGWSGGMKQPRCGTGGDKSGRLYFCRPLSRHGAHPYPRSLSLSLHLALHLAHLCCHTHSLSLSLALSCSPCLSADACSSYPLSALSLFLFLCLRHHSSQLTSSHC